MATEILVKTGTPVVWADATDFSGTNNGYTRTAQLDLTSLANGAARQGDKADLGAARAAQYSVHVGIEFGTAPTAATQVDVYWSSSFSATAGTGNAGGASGADGAYAAASEAAFVKQLTYVGTITLTNNGAGTVQRQCVNDHFAPPQRYGMPVVYNRAGQTFDTDATEMYVALVPLVDEAQTA